MSKNKDETEVLDTLLQLYWCDYKERKNKKMIEQTIIAVNKETDQKQSMYVLFTRTTIPRLIIVVNPIVNQGF